MYQTMLHKILSFLTIVLEPTTKGQSHYTRFLFQMIRFALKIDSTSIHGFFSIISHECLSLWAGPEPLGDEALGCLPSTCFYEKHS
jgi:hypothetical protein